MADKRRTIHFFKNCVYQKLYVHNELRPMGKTLAPTHRRGEMSDPNIVLGENMFIRAILVTCT